MPAAAFQADRPEQDLQAALSEYRSSPQYYEYCHTVALLVIAHTLTAMAERWEAEL
jgi:hypothetical protein